MFCTVLSFFFFKQKTAYEMRISDWSSDVCSSDLADLSRRLPHRLPALAPASQQDIWRRSPPQSWNPPACRSNIQATLNQYPIRPRSYQNYSLPQPMHAYAATAPHTVVYGTILSLPLDLGCRRLIKQNTIIQS